MVCGRLSPGLLQLQQCWARVGDAGGNKLRGGRTLCCSTKSAFSPVEIIRKHVTRVTCALKELGVQVKAGQCQYSVVLPQSLCVVCSSCLVGGWVQASGAAAFPPRHSSWLCLCSACALPVHPIRATSSAAGWRLLLGGSSILVVPAQLSWAPCCRRDPGPCSQP